MWKLFSVKKRGFLLIELLMSLGMFSILALGVTTYYHYLAVLHKTGKNRLEATSIARTALEHLRAGREELIQPRQGLFTIDYQKKLPINGFFRISVSVSWQENKARKVTLETGLYHENA